MTEIANDNSKPLLTVFLTIFIDMLGIGVLIPIFPLLILPHSEFRIIPDSWPPTAGYILLGWLSASFPLAQFIFTPLLGQLSDQFGRKKVLALSICGTGIAYLLFAIGIVTKNIPLLFFSRIMDGCTGGNISVAQAVIADISTPQRRAKNFALVGMAFGLGFILGPFIGGILADPSLISWFNAATPFYFTAILSWINMFFVLVFLPETLKVKSNNPVDLSRSFSNVIQAFSNPGLRHIMPSTFFSNAGFTFFTTFFAVTLAHKYNFTQGRIGNYFAYIGIMIVLAQGIVVRRIAKYCQDYQVLRFSMFGTASCLVIYFFIPTAYELWIYCVPPFLAIFNALTMAFNATLVTRITPSDKHGEGLGITSSIMALAQVIPAILSGYVATLDPSLPIVAGSFTVFLGGLLFWLLFKPAMYANNNI